MSDSLVMLAKTYAGQDPTGWWMSEKLDGVRLLWTGAEALSRNGKLIAIPDSLWAQLPAIALDGELWLGRGRFQETVSIVRRQTPDARWDRIQYRIFDAPLVAGGFEVRLNAARQAIDFARPGVAVLEQVRCLGQEHLTETFRDAISAGAEGVMLRRPGSDYSRKRSADLLKYKPCLMGIDAMVVGHQEGLGKHTGRLGALLCTFIPGQAELAKLQPNYTKIFGVGTGLSDTNRENPPAIGSTIRISCFELTDDGLPRFPVYEGGK
jgi:DNA ligase 1